MTSETNETFAPTLWAMHAGREGVAEALFFGQGFIATGWRAAGDLRLLADDRAAFREKIAASHPDKSEHAITNYTTELYRFVHVMRVGDYVACRTLTPVDGIAYVFLGRVAGPYVFNPFLNDHFSSVRRIEWLRSVPVSQLSPGAQQEVNNQRTLIQVDTHAAEFLALIATSK